MLERNWVEYFLITRAPKKIIAASNNCSFLHRLHLQANKQRISKTLKAPPKKKLKYIFHETVNKHKYLQKFFALFGVATIREFSLLCILILGVERVISGRRDEAICKLRLTKILLKSCR